MEITTTVKPLITNFMAPHMPEVVSSDEVKFIYDPQSQITLYMGGGNGKTRSNDGYKGTKEKVNGGYYEHNDAERWTDD